MSRYIGYSSKAETIGRAKRLLEHYLMETQHKIIFFHEYPDDDPKQQKLLLAVYEDLEADLIVALNDLGEL